LASLWQTHPVDVGVLFVNTGSGSAGELSAVRARAGELGVEVVELGDDHEATMASTMAQLPDLSVVGAGGGDGTMAGVATWAMRRAIAFVCVPLGTRNHLARDLGLDRDDPVAALEAFTDRVEKRIDVGRVNGRVFLNNVTFGLYAEVVDDEQYRDASVRTSLRVTREVLRGDRAADPVEVRAPDEIIESPLAVMVANNRYAALEVTSLGVRDRLDDGVLQVWVLEAEGMAELVSVAAAAVTPGRQPGELDHVTTWETGQLELTSSESVVGAAIDGEAVVLDMPARFTVDRRALRVWTPA
jgi:diacylglycerol kinase family enzyme